MSHNIYTEKFTTATSIRNEILKRQDKKIKALIIAIKMMIMLTGYINTIRARTKSKIIQEKSKIKETALMTVFDELNITEEILRELLGTKTLTAMTNNFTTAEENRIAQEITKILEVLKNAEII